MVGRTSARQARAGLSGLPPESRSGSRPVLRSRGASSHYRRRSAGNGVAAAAANLASGMRPVGYMPRREQSPPASCHCATAVLDNLAVSTLLSSEVSQTPSTIRRRKMAAQGGWRWCHRCQGLWFAGGGSGRGGSCPRGGGHHQEGSGNYSLQSPAVPGQQANWQWCHKCEGLWFAGHPDAGRCPADNQGHEHKDSSNYGVNTPPVPGQQINWRWCNRCEGMFFAGGSSTGACPKGGGHDFNHSGLYGL